MFDLSVIKSVLPTLIFDTVLPTVDSGSDLILILRWYTTGHVKYATAMAIPFMINAKTRQTSNIISGFHIFKTYYAFAG